MYDDWLEEACAIQAYFIGDFGALTCLEIEWLNEAADEIGLSPRLPFDVSELSTPTPIHF